MKTSHIIIILGIIISGSVIFALTFEYSFENKYDPDISLSDIPEIINYKGKNCNTMGIDDISCFVNSFNQCLPAKIKNTHNTIEGDPITIIAMIQSETICSIDVFHDSTQDKFGKQEITKYTCPEIKLDEGDLHFVHCKSEFDDFEYGFSIRK